MRKYQSSAARQPLDKNWAREKRRTPRRAGRQRRK